MTRNQVKSPSIRSGQKAECLLFSPKQPLRNTDLDSVSMSAFGHKQSFRFYAYTCILTVNERLLSAVISMGRCNTLNKTLEDGVHADELKESSRFYGGIEG